jgi:hypothetical protein
MVHSAPGEVFMLIMASSLLSEDWATDTMSTNRPVVVGEPVLDDEQAARVSNITVRQIANNFIVKMIILGDKSVKRRLYLTILVLMEEHYRTKSIFSFASFCH